MSERWVNCRECFTDVDTEKQHVFLKRLKYVYHLACWANMPRHKREATIRREEPE